MLQSVSLPFCRRGICRRRATAWRGLPLGQESLETPSSPGRRGFLGEGKKCWKVLDFWDARGIVGGPRRRLSGARTTGSIARCRSRRRVSESEIPWTVPGGIHFGVLGLGHIASKVGLGLG